MGSGGIYFLMTQRVADIPTVNTHPPPSLPPCLFLSVRSHRHAFALPLLFFCSPIDSQLGLEGGEQSEIERGEKKKKETHIIRL